MGVLDQGGYLSRYQQRLARLSLVTDGTCPQTWHRLEGLSELSSLTAFEWEGIQHQTEVDLLRQCISHNWSHLDHLSIGFVYSASARALCWESLGLQGLELGVGDIGVEKPTAVPTLSSLALSRVTLPPNLSSENSSIFCSLRALTLRDCPNQLRLLQLLSRSQNPLQLEHFETSLDLLLHEPGDGCSLSAVVRFLRSFRGLQHLHLRLSNFPASESRIQDAIKHHQTTLKSLVYHERQLAPIGEDGLFEDDRDVSPVWIANLSTIVDLGQVTALALCARPSAAVSLCQPSERVHANQDSGGAFDPRQSIPSFGFYICGSAVPSESIEMSNERLSPSSMRHANRIHRTLVRAGVPWTRIPLVIIMTTIVFSTRTTIGRPSSVWIFRRQCSSHPQQ
jgi:hypothetical protein